MEVVDSDSFKLLQAETNRITNEMLFNIFIENYYTCKGNIKFCVITLNLFVELIYDDYNPNSFLLNIQAGSTALPSKTDSTLFTVSTHMFR